MIVNISLIDKKYIQKIGKQKSALLLKCLLRIPGKDQQGAGETYAQGIAKQAQKIPETIKVQQSVISTEAKLSNTVHAV